MLFDNTLKQRTEALATTIGQGAQALDQTLKNRTEVFAATVGQGAGILDRTMKDRTEAFTNLVSQGAVVLDKTLQERTNALATAIGQGADALNKTLADRTGQFNAVIDQKAALLDRALVERAAGFAVAVDQRASAMDKSLHDRTAQFIAAINQGAIVLDKTLAERSESFTNSLFQRVKALETAISQQTGSLDKTMTERAQAVIVALAERLKAIDMTFNQRAVETDRMLGEHARATAETFGKQTAQLNQVLANNSAIMQQTANQVGAQSKEAVTILTSQTQTLREVSRGLLEQIHGLTQRFENQGQAILAPPRRSHSSNTKIDLILEGRHQSIIALLHTVNTKAQDLDNMMRSYAGMVENAMTLCGSAREASWHGARPRHGGSGASRRWPRSNACATRRKPTPRVRSATSKASFETVITQIGRQLEQMRGQFDNTSRGMRETAQKTASDLDSLRQEMQKRMEGLPEHTAQATAAIRKALSEQLREIEAITAPVLSRPAAPPQAPAPDPFRQAAAQPRPQPFQPAPQPAFQPAPSPVRSRSAAAFRCQGAAGRLAGRRYRSGRGRACQSAQQRRAYAAAGLCRRGPRHAGGPSGARRRTAPPRRDRSRHRLPDRVRRVAAFQGRRAWRARPAHLHGRRPGDVRRDGAPLRPRARFPHDGRPLYRRLRAAARRRGSLRPRRPDVAELPDQQSRDASICCSRMRAAGCAKRISQS